MFVRTPLYKKDENINRSKSHSATGCRFDILSTVQIYLNELTIYAAKCFLLRRALLATARCEARRKIVI